MALTTILQPETGLTQTAATFPPTADYVNQSVSGVPDSCIILGLNATIPWDNPHNLVSMETERLFDRIKSAIVIPALFLVGFPANCINMAVFFRQGLRERINLCLFSLALVDLICLTEIFAPNAERIYTQFTDGEPMGPVLRYMVNNNVIGLYGFLYGSMFLYAIISVERCVCILFPLRAKTCISTKAIAFVTVAGVLVVGFGRFSRHYCHVSSLVLPRDSHSADYVETQRERLLFPEQSHDQRFGRTDLWGGSHGRLPGYRNDSHHHHGRQTHSSCPLAQPDFLQSVQQRD